MSVTFQLKEPTPKFRQPRILVAVIALIAVTTLTIGVLRDRSDATISRGAHDVQALVQFSGPDWVAGWELSGWVDGNTADVTLTIVTNTDPSRTGMGIEATRVGLGPGNHIRHLRYRVQGGNVQVADLGDSPDRDPVWGDPSEGDPVTLWDPTDAFDQFNKATHTTPTPTGLEWALDEYPLFDLVTQFEPFAALPVPEMLPLRPVGAHGGSGGEWLIETDPVHVMYWVAVFDIDETDTRALPET